MSLTQYEQFAFDLGETAPEYEWRPDLKVRGRSLKSAQNVRPRYSGAAETRFGSEYLFAAAGDGWLAEMSIDGVAYFLVVTAARVDVRLKSDRSLVQSLTSAPWTADMLPDLVIESYGKQAFIFHQEMAPQIIERADAGTWSRTAWAPADGTGGTKRQPFYRYATRGITLTPSALTGSVTLTASAACFTASHVGLRLRLQGREVTVTAFTDTTHVTATVNQTLHETVNLTLDSTAGFSVGELVEGLTSGSVAEVVEVTSSTVMKVLKQDYKEFYYEGAATDKREMVQGPNAASRMNAAESAAVTPVGVVAWTEQAMSDYRGWPASGTVHAGRLWFARLPLVPFGVMASEIDDFLAFEVGTGDSDAIFEEIRDSNAGAIRWLVSAEQLLILTSTKSFYVPESESNPIRPTSMAFTPIDPPGASTCKPVVLSEGLAFVEKGGAELVGLFPTGDVRRSWRTMSLSYLAPHLIQSPRSMAYVSPSDDSPERQVFMANADGGATMLTYTETDADALPSLVPWVTTGDYRAFAAIDGECWALVKRTVNGADAYLVEAFTSAATMDGVLDTGVLQGAATTETIAGPEGSIAADVIYRQAEYAGTTCSLVVDGAYIGEVTLDADGDYGAPEGGTTYEVGFKFAVECIPWPPMDPQDQTARRRKKRICRAIVRWTGRYLAVDGSLQPAYRAEDDMNEPPPERDETTRVPTFGGWSDSPTITISHDYPGPWKMLGLSMEVAG